MAIIHPAWRTILRPQAPQVKLIDLKTSTGNSTSYSFTNVQPKTNGNGSFSTETITSGSADGSYPRTPSESIFVVVVHASDALTVYGITSVVWGGVALTEIVDIGPAANLSCTAIYWTTGAALEARTTDTIVVTPTESITGCAIGVIEITNFGTAQTGGTGSSTGTGGMPIDIGSADIPLPYYFIISGFTTAPGTAETLIWDCVGGINPLTGYQLLYESHTTEFSIAAMFAYSPQYIGIPTTSPGYVNVDWSGALAGSHALALFRS